MFKIPWNHTRREATVKKGKNKRLNRGGRLFKVEVGKRRMENLRAQTCNPLLLMKISQQDRTGWKHLGRWKTVSWWIVNKRYYISHILRQGIDPSRCFGVVWRVMNRSSRILKELKICQSSFDANLTPSGKWNKRLSCVWQVYCVFVWIMQITHMYDIRVLLLLYKPSCHTLVISED